ncbi:hypothetical protein [Robertkochia flava]|uniref:hypothetical protein n=1 Tax=Robertkochia flava TaxID=3447986 RepID=UPI001CCB6517|nr:hypothetical protein [Robertkochia marina]
MKRVLQILILLFGIFLVWYFIIKPNDYNIHFKAQTSAGLAYDELLNWSAVSDLPESSAIKDPELYKELTQEVDLHGATYVLNWTITRINDSITGINAGIKQPGKSLINRLLIPFSNTRYEEQTLELVKNYK